MLHLKEGEKIILITRRHWIVLLFYILPTLLIMDVILIALIALPFLSLGQFSDWLGSIFPLAEFNIKLVLAFILANIFLILWQVLFVQIAHYYLDAWIITDERTLHTELFGLFNRFLSSVYHHRIQDVSVDVKGILQTFFEYGNVQIQTAGSFREFVFREIPRPYQTKEIINRAQMDFLRKLRQKGQSPEKVEETTEGLITDDDNTS
jgi:uncharacterized membrane protein YdbT with pleckstrin-like domain